MPDAYALPGWDRPKVESLVRGIAAALAGTGPDPFGVARAIQIRCGVRLLQLIQERFVVMARGEPDPLGGPEWPDLSPYTIAKKMKIGLAEAREMMKGADYSIGIDTNLMFRSLSPGVSGPSGDPNQVFEIQPGVAIVGTNLERSDWFHRGTVNQPARPLWTDPLPEEWAVELATTESEAIADAIALIVSTQQPPPDAFGLGVRNHP